MAYYKRLFGNDSSRSEFTRDEASIAYAKRLMDTKDKVHIGDKFDQKIKPKELNGFGTKDTVRHFTIVDIYENFVVAKTQKGEWNMAFTYPELMESEIAWTKGGLK